MLSFSEGVHAELAAAVRKGRGRRGGRDRRSTCAATPAGCSTRRCSAPASSCPRAKSSSRPNPAPRATASTRPSAATCRSVPLRRPDQPQHRLRGGDPHRRAGRRRRRAPWSAPAPTARASSRRTDLANGGALKLTVGEYFTPDGVNLAEATASTRTSRSATTRTPRSTRRKQRALGVLAGQVEGLSGGAAQRSAARSAERRAAQRRQRRPRGGRGDCSREQLGFRGFRAALEAEAARGGRGGRARLPVARRDLTALRPSPSTRPPPATSTTPSPPSARATGPGSGSTSPTSPPTCGRARRSTSRRAGAPTAPTCPGSVEPMLPHALSSDACSLAPGVERLAVTAEIELGPGRAAALDPLLPQPHPLRRPPRLRPARRDLRRPRAGAGGGRRTARRRPRRRRRARRAARRDQPRRRIAPSPSSSFDAKGNVTARPRRRPDRVAPADRAADDPHQRAGRRAARSSAGCRRSTGSTPQPDPTADRAPGRAARLARRADAAARPGPLARAGRRDGGGGEPAGAARGRAARTRPRGVYIARAPLAQTGRLQRAQQRPRRARQRRLHALHLADPPLSRPASSTGRCWRRWGRGRRRRAWHEARDVAADCSARERESAKIERGADDVCAAFLLERELGERGLDAVFEGEVSGVIRAGAFVPFGGELGDVYEGMLPARRLPGERYELDRAEVALVGRGSGGDAAARRPDRGPRHRGRGPARPRRPGARRWLRRSKKTRACRPPATSPPTAAPATNSSWSRRWRRGSSCSGSEVKSLRGGKAQMTDAYAVVEDGEVWLRKLHIPPYEFPQRRRPRSRAAAQTAPAPRRDRAADRQNRAERADPDPDPDLLQGPPRQGRAGAGARQGRSRPAPRDRRPRRPPRGRARVQGSYALTAQRRLERRSVAKGRGACNCRFACKDAGECESSSFFPPPSPGSLPGPRRARTGPGGLLPRNVSDYVSDHTGLFVAALVVAILLLLLVVSITQRRSKEKSEEAGAATAAAAVPPGRTGPAAAESAPRRSGLAACRSRRHASATAQMAAVPLACSRLPARRRPRRPRRRATPAVSPRRPRAAAQARARRERAARNEKRSARREEIKRRKAARARRQARQPAPAPRPRRPRLACRCRCHGSRRRRCRRVAASGEGSAAARRQAEELLRDQVRRRQAEAGSGAGRAAPRRRAGRQ